MSEIADQLKGSLALADQRRVLQEAAQIEANQPDRQWDEPCVPIEPAPLGSSFGLVKHSPTIGKIGAALAKAQGQIKGAAKDSTNPHFSSHYADLASVAE